MMGRPCTVYGLYDIQEPGIICYVGSTIQSPSTRLRNHLNSSTPNIKQWIDTVGVKQIRITVLEICDESIRGVRERYYINSIEGLLNVETKPKGFVMPKTHLTKFIGQERSKSLCGKDVETVWITSNHKKVNCLKCIKKGVKQ